MSAKTETTVTGVERVKISANSDNSLPKLSLRSTQENEYQHVVFYPLIIKLQAFEVLKWVQGSQWRKQRTFNLTRERQPLFSRLRNTAFYVSTAVKYSCLKICIIFNQYFPVFHYFVYFRCKQLTP